MKYERNKAKLGLLRGTKKKRALKVKKIWREMEVADLPDGSWD